MPQQVDERRVPPDFMGTIYSDVLLTNSDDRTVCVNRRLQDEPVGAGLMRGIANRTARFATVSHRTEVATRG